MYLSLQNQEATKESVTVATNPPPVESSTTPIWEQDRCLRGILCTMLLFLGTYNIEMNECQLYDVITTT